MDGGRLVNIGQAAIRVVLADLACINTTLSGCF